MWLLVVDGETWILLVKWPCFNECSPHFHAKKESWVIMPPTGGGGDSSVLDANYPPPPEITVDWRPPWGAMGRGSRRGLRGGGSGRVGWGRGAPGAAIWGGGGGGAQASLTPPCPPSNHTITINLTLTFLASWFGHANHVDCAE